MKIPIRIALLGGLWLAQPAAAQAQQPGRFTISGYVRDGATGESLPGVAVVHPASGQGTTTNPFGFYSLTLPVSTDSVRLLVSSLGYERQRLARLAERSFTHDFRLKASSAELAGVEVVGTREEKLAESTRMGTINVPVAQIKLLPALFGETDVLKVLQLLPGVQAGGEGQSGLYVRGGSPDQNLLLLDGTPVYNASHLFGFFSVFNADAIKNVELIKGGFPARYGGRLSSVVDITMKEGNMQKFHGEGAIGIIASRLTLEGPIKKDTASFIFSARRTYIDILARPFILAQANGLSAGYYFYDLNGKLNWKVSARDRLYLSGYSGYDEFYADDENKRDNGQYNKQTSALGWGNRTAALRWNRVINDRLFMNTHLTYTRYQFSVGIESEDRFLNNGQLQTDKFALTYLSNIQDLSVKSDFDYLPNPNHYIRFGGQYIRHLFRPGALQTSGSVDPSQNQVLGRRIYADEASIYAEDDVKLTDRLKVNIGARFNNFLVDKKLYPSLEPRLAARYLLTEDWSLKASYARTSQFIHLLTNSGIGLPTDLWVPATARIKPQRAQQVSAGVARNLRFKNEDYELSFETYYKPMQNLIEFREGADFIGTSDDNYESKITSGNGLAYGGEVFVQKKSGRTTGWLGYTLAWSTRRFAELNQGQTFPYKYDRRHDLKLVIIHEFSPTLTLSGTAVYGSGNATTLSQGRYQLGPFDTYEDYGSRNSYRMAPYHRLDLDLSKTKKKRWGEVVNSFSVYNAYNRRNPYFIYLGRKEGSEDLSYRQVSLFPILPSFSKTFRF
ncbi:TonB-dependent receptor [Hymenobacter arizonensis]|uniref:CarboxypepD_reg-like domain-containing protein n=1 Tax=Hymenobacter arizonensis TaxID=1227077 RepID=A0A1I5ZS17_HYMAR|nr:TonB-dependent receptor [Hymenobacter arizonensis]SFQ59266.1 CarboxypepD_reg-like domain-containing protein [Hymenobacter arizonensis]